jgi:hypothetical protein
MVRETLANELFCQNVLQHRLVQAEIGHELLQLPVLLLELAQPPHL